MDAKSGEFRLDGKVAIVTGAGRGLGREIAVALARAGAAVSLVARSVAQLEETASIIAKLGGQALVFARDVTEPDAAEQAVKATGERFGRCDILVAGAGTAVTRSALQMSVAEWDQVMAVNLRAPFFWSQAAGRAMAENGGGRIIHLASITAEAGVPKLAAYGASKGGLTALTRILAVEWAPLGITVNAIAAGYVRTALNEEALADDRVMDYITHRTPMHRLGKPEEVAAAAVFLASQEAAFITGHVLAVDGGWLAS